MFYHMRECSIKGPLMSIIMKIIITFRLNETTESGQRSITAYRKIYCSALIVLAIYRTFSTASAFLNKKRVRTKWMI